MEVEEILEQIDILEYIQQFCELEEKNGEWWGLSPFKEEKTPSFSINTEKQKFYDFSSGTGGNLINFVMKYNNCNFIEAINILKKYANITEDSLKFIGRLTSTKVIKKFRHRLPAVKESKSVVLPSNYMDRYDFNESKLKSWADEGISYETMKKFDVRYDSFSDRIVFPIKDCDGNIINVCGRILDNNYKEKKLRKYTYFKPLGCLNTLYGFSDNKESILREKEIILFEGAKSVMIASEWGINNTCAICTSHLNPQQLILLIKLGVRVVLALDEDVDVTKDINIAKLKRYVKVEWVKNRNNSLNSKMAPVDAGYEVWQSLYKNRIPLN